MPIMIRAALILLFLSSVVSAQSADKLAAMRSDLAGQVEGMKKRTQVMVDSVFSFAELGFQEVETSRYLTNILEKEGFKIETGIAGVPTAWIASWGSGKPVISLGSDIDCIPQASQKPGVAYREPLIEGAPGHGEGHNSGVAVNITAALAIKRLMEREKLPGTIRLWPGVAEEQLGAKAHYVRAGYFKDVDVVIFTHVSSELATSWGDSSQTGMVSVEYTFEGESAHSAGAPWRGRSALDAVELMDIGWNFRREHLRLQQRSHYVITNGGDQPNVVPRNASVWYFFRELDYPMIMDLWKAGDEMAQGAALMTKTKWTSRVLGSAWPNHGNKPIAEAMYKHIQSVGIPVWSEDDQAFAKAVQKMLGNKETNGLKVKLEELKAPSKPEQRMGGGSDDIGDIMWNVPTVTLQYPSNIPGLPGHNWANAMAMATPIAHKGATTGAKVLALTLLDILTQPELVKNAWDYFRNVQTKELQYKSFLRPEDKPAIWLNRKIMAEYLERMKPLYFDSSKYDNYLDQLGVKYPTLEKR
jgi:aminobenzoyl-glutamate utilization protein B